MAKKKGMASGGYEIGRLVDQSGGMVDSVVHPTLLQDHEAALLKNVSLDEKGTVKPCLGRIERFEEPFDPDNPCNGITAFYPDTATSRLVVGAGTKLYKDIPHLVERWDSESEWAAWSGRGIDTSGGNLKIKDPAGPDLPDIIHKNREDWEKQTRENVDIDANPGKVHLAKTGADLKKSDDFKSGELNNVAVTHYGLELGVVGLTWDDLSGMKWEDL